MSRTSYKIVIRIMETLEGAICPFAFLVCCERNIVTVRLVVRGRRNHIENLLYSILSSFVECLVHSDIGALKWAFVANQKMTHGVAS